MVIIETILGNISTREWADRLAASEVDVLEIDQWEAQKSRFRKMTAKGADVAISVDRGTYLRDGDVLLWDAEARSALVARIEVRDVMIVHLDELVHVAPEVAHAYMRRTWTCDGQPALASTGQGQPRLCSADSRP